MIDWFKKKCGNLLYEMFLDRVTTENDTNPELKAIRQLAVKNNFEMHFDARSTTTIYSQLIQRKALKVLSENNLIPFATVFQYADLVFRHQYKQYIETTDDEAFSVISTMFFKHLFWNNEIWVRYDAEKDIFQLWDIIDGQNTAELQEKDKTKFEFINLFTNVTEKFDIKTDIIRVYWDGDFHRNVLLPCYTLMYYYLVNRTLIQENFQIASKSTAISLNASEIALKEKTKCMLDASSVLLSIGDGNDVYPRKLDILAYADWRQGAEAWNNLFLSELSTFGGCLCEDRDKGSRLSEGENFKDIKRFFDDQTQVLKQLNIFAKKAQRYWGKNLHFELINKPETSGINANKSETSEINVVKNVKE